MRRLAVAVLAFAGLGICAHGCGARSALTQGSPDAGPPPKPCVQDEDCLTNLCEPSTCLEGVCVPLPVVSCDDGNACTEDTCAPETGKCSSTPLTADADGDGFRAPLPGRAPGTPGACGDDCDDTRPLARPGGKEVCDGADNDCNGVVDDGAAYQVPSEAPILVSSATDKQASRGGLTWDGTKYALTYAAQTNSWKNYFKALDARGRTLIAATSVTGPAGDVFTGPIVWTGSQFATVWEDRREGDSYDIYFNRLDTQGRKFSTDLRLTDQPGYSLHADLLLRGNEFLVVWDDDSNGETRAYGRRVSLDGKPLANFRELTAAVWQAESPHISQGIDSIGLAFTLAQDSLKRVGFRRFSPALESPGELVVLSDAGSVAPIIVFNNDRYVVAWEKHGATPGDAVWGAALDERGSLRNPARKLTYGNGFARSPALIPLGNRLLLIWAEYQAGHYQLFSKILSAELSEILPPRQITFTSGDSLEPIAALGPNGDVGILFEYRSTGSWQIYFQRLTCVGAF
jgi:hypothetical protein